MFAPIPTVKMTLKFPASRAISANLIIEVLDHPIFFLVNYIEAHLHDLQVIALFTKR